MYLLYYMLSRLAEGFHDGLDCCLAVDIEDAVFIHAVSFFDNLDTQIYCCEFRCENIMVYFFAKVLLFSCFICIGC